MLLANVIDVGVTWFIESPWTIFILACLLTPHLYFTYHNWRYPMPGATPFSWIGTCYGHVQHLDQIHIYDFLQNQKYNPRFDGMFKAWLFMLPVVAIGNRDDIRDVYVREFENYDRSKIEQQVFADLLGDGLILASNGDDWHFMRTLLAPAFSHVNLEWFLPQMIKVVSLALDDMQPPISGEVIAIDVQKHMATATFRLGSLFVLGVDIHELLPDSEALWGRVLRTNMNKILGFTWHWRFIETHGSRQYKQDLTALRQTITKAIELAEAVDEDVLHDRTDILALLLQAHQADSQSVTKEQMIKQLLTFIFAGHDTTSNLLTWALYHIAKDKSVQQSVHDEIDKVVGPNTAKGLSYSNLNDLVYLKAVTQETLRLYPSAPIRGRTVREDTTTASGFKLGSGQSIAVNSYAMHRNPQVWQECKAFQPARFLKSGGMQRSPFDYLPFGLGPRRCIGERLANMTAMVTLCMVLQRYTLQVEPTHPVVEELALTMRAKHGVLLYLSKRNLTV